MKNRDKKEKSREARATVKEVFRRAFTKQPEIRTYFGLTGSGKTTIAVAMMEKIYRRSKKRGREVNIYTNIDCYLPFVKRIEKSDLIDGRLKDGYVFYDEASLDFNNREFKKFSRDNQEFFRYHRKNKLHVYVFSQTPEDTDKVIRTLSHRYYVIGKWWIFSFVKPIGVEITVDDITKEIKTCYNAPPRFWCKCYCWLRWSFKFDTYKRTGDKQVNDIPA